MEGPGDVFGRGPVSCIYQDVTVASIQMWLCKEKGQTKTRHMKRMAYWSFYQVDWRSGGFTRKLGKPNLKTSKNQQHPLTKATTCIVPKQGSSSSRQGDQKTLGTCKSRPGQIHDKHLWNGSCHLDVATSYTTKKTSTTINLFLKRRWWETKCWSTKRRGWKGFPSHDENWTKMYLPKAGIRVEKAKKNGISRIGKEPKPNNPPKESGKGASANKGNQTLVLELHGHPGGPTNHGKAWKGKPREDTKKP